MRRIDEQYLKTPYFGARRMGKTFASVATGAGRLLRLMGWKRSYPKPRLSQNTTEHRDFTRICCEMCRSCGPTSVGQRHHLRAHAAGLDVLDGGHGLVQSLRVVVAVVEYLDWTVLPGGVCEAACVTARRRYSTPTRACSTRRKRLLVAWRPAGVAGEHDGRGRWMDNVFVERLWRPVKYEHLYLHDYATPHALEAGLSGYFPWYNEERIHSSLDYRTPMVVYLAT